MISDDRIEGIWRQVLDVFRGGILADWQVVFFSHSLVLINMSCPASSTAEALPLETQEAEENFDLALIASLEIDVAPHLGDSRVPDYLVSQLAQILHRGSVLYEVESEPGTNTPPATEQRSEKVEKVEFEYDLGSTEFGSLVPRERFSYWCFDLLFLICSNTTNGECELHTRRDATNFITS